MKPLFVVLTTPVQWNPSLSMKRRPCYEYDRKLLQKFHSILPKIARKWMATELICILELRYCCSNKRFPVCVPVPDCDVPVSVSVCVCLCVCVCEIWDDGDSASGDKATTVWPNVEKSTTEKITAMQAGDEETFNNHHMMGSIIAKFVSCHERS